MDLSDIIPFLIIIGGAFMGFVGKSANNKKNNGDAKHRTLPTHGIERHLPPIPAGRKATPEHLIPFEEKTHPGQAPAMPRQTPYSENYIQTEQKTAIPTTTNPYYTSSDDNSNTPQDWRKAIIAYEIMKTKF